MREQTAEEILKAVKKAVDGINLALIEVGDKVRAKTVSTKRIGDIDWGAVKTAILAEPAPSPEQKRVQLREIKAGPYFFRSDFLHCMKRYNYRFGGHPRALRPEQELAACKMIEQYRVEEPLDTSAAIDRVAIELNWKKHTVSPKTLRRRFKEYRQNQDAKSSLDKPKQSHSKAHDVP